MRSILRNQWLPAGLVGCLVAATPDHALLAQCACDEEQQVVFKLRGIGVMAGSATVRISWGDNEVYKSMKGGATVYNGAISRYEAMSFECVQWDADVTVNPKLNEPVQIEYLYETDDQNSGYTEFQEVGSSNPVTYWTRPSSSCLTVYFDRNDRNWVPASGFFEFGDVIRMKGVMPDEPMDIGESPGLVAGGGIPLPNVTALMDAPAVGDLSNRCPGGSSMVSSPSVTTDGFRREKEGTPRKLKKGKIPRYTQSAGAAHLSKLIETRGDWFRARISGGGFRGGMIQTHPALDVSSLGRGIVRLGDTFPEYSLVTTESVVGSNGVSIADSIGRLRWEMSLGSVERKHPLGDLIYQADVLDALAYSPERLRVGLGSDVSQAVTDTNGFLRQILVSDQLVDIPGLTNGFQVVVYPEGQFGPVDSQTGLFELTGVPELSWRVENPDTSPQGRIRFSKTHGTNSEVHEAHWQGSAGTNGTMTIQRFNGKWKDVTEYSLNATQRVETISGYRDDVLQYKTREVYQEFYNWGNDGDIFEAMVERVVDPDNRALTTTFQYWDSTNQPGDLLYRTTYPGGMTMQVPNRISGSGLYPVVAPGDPARLQRTYRDFDAGSIGGETIEKNFNVISGQLLQEETVTTKNTVQTGYQLKYHDFGTPGVWGRITYDADGTGAFAYQEEWVDLTTRKPIFVLDQTGRTRTYYESHGHWNSATSTLDVSPSAGTIEAFRTTVVHGTLAAPNGVSDKTTVDVMVEDPFGQTVLEELYISNGTGGVSESRLVSRTIRAFEDGRLTSTTTNGRTTYEANYFADGLLDWEKDETGRRTEYGYDEMKRLAETMVLGRGGDADRTTTYDYDGLGHIVSRVTVAGGLTNRTSQRFNLAGELVEAVGVDGLTNFTSTSYSAGFRVVTNSLPTGATMVSSFFKDGQRRSVTGTAVEDEFYESTIVQWAPGNFREELAIYRDAALTQLKSAREINWLGNEVRVQKPTFQDVTLWERVITFDSYLDFSSNVISRTLPVMMSTTGSANERFTYDEVYRLSSRGMDLNDNGVLDAVSVEPINTFATQFINTNGTWEIVAEAKRYLTDNADSLTLARRSRLVVPAALPTNVLSSNIVEHSGGGRVATGVVLDHGTGRVTTTITDQNLGRVSSRVHQDGLLREEWLPELTIPRTYLYTSLSELEAINDPVNGSVTNAYDLTTRRLLSVTDSLNRQTEYEYYPAGVDNAGRVQGVKDALGNWTYLDYHPQGQTFRQWGVNVYPLEQRYDEAGRMTNLMTFRTVSSEVDWSTSVWPDPPSGDVTSWVYDQPSGLLERKLSADTGTAQQVVSYTYDLRGLPDTRTNGRGQIIDYHFDSMGRMTNVVYPDGTPPVEMSYDRAGRLRFVSDAAGTRSLDWTDLDQPGDENYLSGLLSGVTVVRDYDAASRLSTLELGQGGAGMTRQRFAYDAISRLDYLADESPDGLSELHRFDYSYLTNTPHVHSIEFLREMTSVMTNVYHRDGIGRLTGVTATLASGEEVNDVGYQLDALNRRYRADLSEGSAWDYGYNTRSEVTTGSRKTASGAFAGGAQFEYGYDDIGNRTETKTGGDESGGKLRGAVYDINAQNQYVEREVPGSVWVRGSAETNLFLHGVAAGSLFDVAREEDDEFFGEAVVDNRSESVHARISVVGSTNGVLSDVSSGERFVPRTPEIFAHDEDGNLVQDGRWEYDWNAENRLISVTARDDIPDAARRRVEFAYDFLGRRIQKVTFDWSGSTYVAAQTNRFVYDGWNLMAVLDADSSLVQSFTWGLDVSGTSQGAGGVGGLLKADFHGVTTTNCYAAYDGNGNVMALVDSASGVTAAEYEYGPFGELIRETGELAKANPIRFSTKYFDEETGLSYYGYRYYNPSTGRWLSKDPIEERGGMNLYGFVANDGVNGFDPVGFQAAFSDINSLTQSQALGLYREAEKEMREYQSRKTFENPLVSDRLVEAINGFSSGIHEWPVDRSKCDEEKCAKLKRVLMYAYVADDVYQDDGGRVAGAPNIKRLTGKEMKDLGIDPRLAINDGIGFFGALYHDVSTGEFLMGFRGTEGLTAGKDWVANIENGIGFFAADQYQAAALFGGAVANANPGQVTVVGHSLGGGLATVAALRGAFQAVTFNAAGVHFLTARRLGIDLDDADELVRGFMVPGDALTRVVNPALLVPNANGRQTLLPSPGSEPMFINRHLMSNVIASIKRALAENGCDF